MSSFLSSRRHRAGNGSHRQIASSADGTNPTTAAHLRSESYSAATNEDGYRGSRRFEARRIMNASQSFMSRVRSIDLNPPVDYRMLDYINQYDENLVCPICRCPFVDPVILTECEHAFCRDCIRQTWPDHPLGPRGNCPTCRTVAKLPARSSTSKIIVNILDDLQVHCPKREQGCATTIKRGEVQDHVALYCGYGMIECLDDDCTQAILRKDSTEGCLHYMVSCMDCRLGMLKAELEQHWKLECPDRKVFCELCNLDVFYREYDQHTKDTCPAISIPCPGRDFGCTIRSKRTGVEAHINDCVLAKLAPFMNAQKQRLDEHETAQREMSRKLELLEQGLANIQQLLDPRLEGPYEGSADEDSLPFLSIHNTMDSFATAPTSAIDDVPIDLDTSFEESRFSQRFGNRTAWRSLPAEYALDTTSSDGTFPLSTSHAPYTSPIHHLLSMHESLRDEITRIQAAVSELDGRQSMHTLNENLRTREEIAYLGGQVAGMSRQVHWLTSAQLQKQQGRRSGTPDNSRDFGDTPGAGAGAGVEAAVNAVASAASALRGAARIVTGSAGPSTVREGMVRRGTSEEGRTKL